MAASGACLTVHFAGWVWGLQHTSLMHGLLLINATPLFMAGGTWLLRYPISSGELLGTAMGLLGVVMLCLGALSNGQVQPWGYLLFFTPTPP